MKRRLTSLVLVFLATGCALESSSESASIRDEASELENTLVLPTPRAGARLLGKSIADLLPERFAGEEIALAGEGAAKATLVRFWTDTCPYCAKSLPAVELLRNRFKESGLQTLGVYHPKPPRPVTDDGIRAAADRLGYSGPVAIDENWEALDAVWPRGEGRGATSISVLADRFGKIRYVHPGPEFHPSDDPSHARCDADYRDLERAVRFVLAE